MSGRVVFHLHLRFEPIDYCLSKLKNVWPETINTFTASLSSEILDNLLQVDSAGSDLTDVKEKAKPKCLD